jgi:hypothetical protein
LRETAGKRFLDSIQTLIFTLILAKVLTEQTALKIYYTAAVTLQSEFSDTLVAAYPQWRPLPDLYSEELGLRASDDATQRLHQLGSIHARLTGSQVNWPGTYRHAAERLIRRLQLEQRWAA